MQNDKITIPLLHDKKLNQRPITMITAYDYPSARLVDNSGIDIVLVGDSLAMTVMGYENTLKVTMNEMIHHCKMVARGTDHALTIGDMPFMSYQTCKSDAINNAGRFLKEGGMDAVKLEGGKLFAPTVKSIVNSGISVMGHIGLTPQMVTKFGGYKVQGKTAEAAENLIEDALSLQDAGCFSIVLEAIPSELAKIITSKVDIPTIGIGAGKQCDGQVLVIHDLLGMYHNITPKFVKQYADLNDIITKALKQFSQDVQHGKFPTEKHTFKMKSNELQKIKTRK